MSVVGLTLGSAANATRPSAAIAASVATSAITRVVGWVRSYQTKPTSRTAPRTSVEAAIQLMSRTGGPKERRAFLRGQRAARAAEHARDLGGEVPAAGEHRVRLRVGDGAAVAEQDHAGGERRRELGVVGGDDAGAQLQALGEGVAPGRIHPAGGLVEQQQFGVGVEHELQRRPLPLAAGDVARVARGELGAGDVGADRLVHQVIARVLGEQRRGAGADAPAGRLDQPGDRLQQRRLARTVAAHQRDRLAGVGVQRHALQDRGPVAQLDPHVLDRECGGALGAAAREGSARVGRGGARRVAAERLRASDGFLGVSPSNPTLVREHPARLLDRHRRGVQPRQREHARGRGRVRASQPRARGLVGDDPAAGELDDAIRRGQAALQPVLGEHDRGPPLLVQPPQDAEQLVAGDGVELGGRLVEQQQPRTAGERGRQGDPLELAAGELVRGPVQQAAEPERQRGLLHPARHRGRGPPEVLEREGELGPHATPSRPASRGPGRASRRRRRSAPARARACRGRR